MRVLVAGWIVIAFASVASATSISYNTVGTVLSCNGVVGCVQNTSTSLSVDGLTFSYNAGSGSSVVTPSIINLGNITSTGAGTNVNVAGLLLTINVNSNPPGASGLFPNGIIAGAMSTNTTSATISFSPNNTTSIFGTLPGIMIGNELYQVLNPLLGLQAPTVGNPVGQTFIQGGVTDVTPAAAVPEPSTLLLLGGGLVGLVRRARQARR